MILLYPGEMNDGNKHKKQETKNHASAPKWKVNTYPYNDLGGYVLDLWVMSNEFEEKEGV